MNKYEAAYQKLEKAHQGSDPMAVTLAIGEAAYEFAGTISSALKIAAGMEWKAIEEAPRDGKSVLVLHKPRGKSIHALAYFVPEFSQESTYDMMDEDFCDTDENGQSWWPEGWYSYANTDDEMHLKINPTRWLPLPPAPEEK